MQRGGANLHPRMGVSMKSGVRDRNNGRIADVCYGDADVSMKSGVRDWSN